MADKPVTLIVSDLHIGAGDKMDDFVYDKDQFVGFLASQAQTAEGRKGEIELILNGDFLEFAQVEPEAYQLGSSRFWCSEKESSRKLDSILHGHPKVFAAIREFQANGNTCTCMAGNHDVDLYWPTVQTELRSAAGPLGFELGETWFSRYGGRLRISHGHMFDSANSFDHWESPILLGPHKIMRLEMCPGTLFMVKFVNWLEVDYPFADNLNPSWRLYTVLQKERQRYGLLAAAWLMAKFASRNPIAALGTRDDPLKVGDRIRDAVENNASFRESIAGLWREVYGELVATEEVACRLSSSDDVEQFMTDMLPKISPDRWVPVFDAAQPGTLSIAKAGLWKGPAALRKIAGKAWDEGAEIVTMGHTHEADVVEDGGLRYYNTGCWTRSVSWSQDAMLTLEDLRDESTFPYSLRYLRVEATTAGALGSELVTYDSQPGS